MSASAFLEATRQRGVHLRAVAGRIQCSPPGSLGADDVAFVVAHKPELLRLLAGAPDASGPAEAPGSGFDASTRPPPPEYHWPPNTYPVEPFIAALEEVEKHGRVDLWQTDLVRRVAAPRPCHLCAGRKWWRLLDAGLGTPGPLYCERCHPPMPPAEAIEWLEVGRAAS